MIQRITVWGLVASILVRGSGIHSEFGRSIVEAGFRALAYASCVDIGNFKEVSGQPRPSFAPFAANGKALQGVHQIDVRSGKRRSRKKAFTDHNYRSIIPDMPHASRRYASVRRRSDRAYAGIWAFDGLSGTLSGQAPGRESQFRTPDPNLSFDSRIATRVSDLNKERQLAMDTNILWALNPAALGPIQVKDLIPDEIKRNKNYAAVAGAIGIVNPYTGGPIGSGSSVLVQGAIEGTAGSANYRSALSKAKVVTSDDKEICEARADKLGIR